MAGANLEILRRRVPAVAEHIAGHLVSGPDPRELDVQKGYGDGANQHESSDYLRIVPSDIEDRLESLRHESVHALRL